MAVLDSSLHPWCCYLFRFFKDRMQKSHTKETSIAPGCAAAAAVDGSASCSGDDGGLSAYPTEVELEKSQFKTAASSASIPPLLLKFKRTRTRIKEVVECTTVISTTAAAVTAAAAGALVSGARLGDTVVVKGWARTVRSANKGKLLFIVLNDGSCPHDLQCVVDQGVPGFEAAQPNKCGGTGAAFSITGVVVASVGGQQAVEVQATNVVVEGCVYAGEGEGELINVTDD
jgi:hypothetical protein